MDARDNSSQNTETVLSLKRHISTLEDEITQLRNKLIKTPVHSYRREGRAIRRLVCLVDPVVDLIAEYDRRIMLAEEDQELDQVASTAEEDRAFRSYNKLVTCCSSVKTVMQLHTELAWACQELKKGADGARGDDANTLKHSVATWLNEQQPPPSPLFLVDDKQGRGFNHDVTGGLLCPVDFSWFDAPTRNAIRDYHPNYPVTARMWPSFLYPNGHFDRADPSKGLFKGEMLVRAFRCVFTSPSSARKELLNLEEDEQRPRKKLCTRLNVAGLLGMRSVQPRAIAYIAVQLRFALSTGSSWDVNDDNFDYEMFYHNIVDWFELPRTQRKAREIEELLLWWNKKAFGRRFASVLEPHVVANSSVALSMA